MNPEPNRRDRLDQAIEAVRSDCPDPAAVEQAAQRVWRRIREAPVTPAIETIRTCADVQALIPAWRAGQLPEARALLVEDHTRECAACRRAASVARRQEAKSPDFQARWIRPQWAMAAGLAVVAALSAYLALGRFQTGAGSAALVEVVDGALYRAGGEAVRLTPGYAVAQSESVRTGPQSRAILRLTDGSRVEMRERSQLRLASDRRGLGVYLGRGGIIVEAARRRTGELYVVTEDCRVAVKGTIFAVTRGVKGSRVAVLQGQVRVEQAGSARLLNPGEQYLSDANLAPADLREEVAWSRHADAYVALLEQWAALRRKLDALPGPPLTYSTRWLDVAPEDTAVYASIPNFGVGLDEAHKVFEQQLDQSPALRRWWQEQMKGKQAALDELLGRIRAFSDYLGPEVVIMLAPEPRGELGAPLVAAEIRRAGFREFLQAEIGKLPAPPKIRIFDDARAVGPASGHELLVLIGRDWAAASNNAARLQALAARLEQPSAGGFARSVLGARLAQAYRNGVGWLIAADLKKVKQPAGEAHQAGLWAGIEDARYAIFERKPSQGVSETRAQILFSGPRRGALSWLAPPTPMGGLEFISREATLAVAFVVKQPAQIFEDLASNPDVARHIREAEAKTGLDLNRELAAFLGGEAAFALDGPLAPKTAWKIVLEVLDPPGLQAGVERLVELANRHISGDGPRWSLTREQAGGRTFYSLRGPVPAELHYAYADGYVIAAPSRALVQQALDVQKAGAGLPRSARFTALLPRDGQPDFSGLIYNDLGTLAAPLLNGLTLRAEQRDSVRAAAQPSLILFYGAPDRIELAARGDLFGIGLETLMGLPRPPFRPRLGRR